ncbi:MAG: hypothetical protein QOE44_2152, partial [Solirubrobacteraceae bacterium]|nr:hypothetical protein [Solirubrobacteraceae bacterium]
MRVRLFGAKRFPRRRGVDGPPPVEVGEAEAPDPEDPADAPEWDAPAAHAADSPR